MEWVDTIRLEESPEVVNVLPRVRADPRGGFLVADVQEAQIRRYTADGRLLWATGGKGQGPLEFRAPAVAIRLPNGEIFVADRDLKMLALDSTGTRITREFTPRLRRVERAALLNDSLVLLCGRSGDPRRLEAPQLHVLNLKRDSITQSFFTPFAQSDPGVAGMMGFVSVSVREERIAAVALPQDSVFVFNSNGKLQHRFKLPTEHFRRVEMISSTDFQDEVKRSEWLASFDTITDVWWLAEDLIVVMYRHLEDREPHWSLLALDTRGEKVFEWLEAPELLGADPSRGQLFFKATDTLVPNVIWIARPRLGRFLGGQGADST